MVVEPKIAPQEGVSKGPVKSRPSDVSPVEVVVVNAEGDFRRGDWLATEEPLEIRVRGAGQEAVSVAVTMRTPGHDAELAVGFLHSEGFLGEPGEVESVGPCLTGAKGRSCNIVSVALAKPFDGASLKRNFVSNSSCGLCGKVALDQIAVRCSRVGPGPIVPKSVIIGLPGTLRDAQAAIDRTGGLHAAGIFDAQGRLGVLREDVGRHNAVDKVIGHEFLQGRTPLSDRILLVSGRTSFEILQKAAVAGLPVVAAVSAPSSLAVSLAERLGITLIGFLRGTSFNIYTHSDRIDMRC